ncbi:MAG: DNA methyltransferase [Rhodobacteraceae bacterium]|nr:DNA methyltransferase [Paracoccaceae bacterium]
MNLFEQRFQSKAGLLDGIRLFNEFGSVTIEEEIGGIPYFVNEFWTAGQRKSHSIHEISYRACFKPQLPEFFIKRLTQPGDTVHDPFMGRGTTPVQAALMHRRVLGNDINPLSTLITRPRLNSITLPEVRDALAGVDWCAEEIKDEKLLTFYHPHTLKGLESLKSWIRAREMDRVADWIRMVALSRLSGHSPGFFSARSMPPNQAVSIHAQERINRRLGQQPPKRDIPAIILNKTRSLLRHGCLQSSADQRLFAEVAWNTRDIENASVDLVVTSPPFLDIVNYASDNWLRCWFAEIDASAVGIKLQRSASGWRKMVRRTLRELARILRSGGHIAFEVGEIRNSTLLLERLVWEAADGLAFKRLGVMVNEQSFTKTSNCWGMVNGRRGTNSNRIVLLRKN